MLYSFSSRKADIRVHTIPGFEPHIRHGMMGDTRVFDIGTIKVYQPQRFFYNGISAGPHDRFFYSAILEDNLISLAFSDRKIVFQDNYLREDIQLKDKLHKLTQYKNFSAYLFNKEGSTNASIKLSGHVLLYVLKGRLKYGKLYNANEQQIVTFPVGCFEFQNLALSSDSCVMAIEYFGTNVV